MDGTWFSDIADELVENILIRLPVKSLKRFSCVNKWWYNHIHSPYFISRHYSHHSSFNHKLLVKFYKLSIFILSENVEDCSNPSLPFLNEDNFIRIVGPCINGIICLTIQTAYMGLNLEDIALWNVATGEYHIFPKLQLSLPPEANLKPYIEGIGFGWVPETNDYKVVIGIEFWEVTDYSLDNTPYRPCEFFVYTLSTDTWKTLTLETSFCPCYIDSAPPSSSQIYVDGVCYWVNPTLEGLHEIISFHVRDEVFGSLPLPDIENPNNDILCLTLHMLDGYIALLHNRLYAENSPFLFDIWVMEESWTKKFTIETLNIRGELGIVKDELFLEDKHGHLLSINIYSQEIKDLGKKGSEFQIQIVEYVESLVTLKRIL